MLNDLILQPETMFYLILTLIAVILILTVIVVINIVTVSKLRGKYNSFMKYNANSSGVTIEELLQSLIDETRNYAQCQHIIEKSIIALEKQIIGCFQKSGIVRYNAFEDTGGDYCYAIALLDNSDSGLLLNGIYNRDTSYIYAKEIKKGKCEKYKLSDEEIEALDIALGKK